MQCVITCDIEPCYKAIQPQVSIWHSDLPCETYEYAPSNEVDSIIDNTLAADIFRSSSSGHPDIHQV